ncbi:MAG: hypothetical protein ACR2MO_10140 [Acidimicrobiales bacterium]
MRITIDRATTTVDAVDPPDHTRLRGLVARAFAPSRIAALEPVIERIALELLDELEASAAWLRAVRAATMGTLVDSSAAEFADAEALADPLRPRRIERPADRLAVPSAPWRRSVATERCRVPRGRTTTRPTGSGSPPTSPGRCR